MAHYGNKSEKPARGAKGSTMGGDTLDYMIDGGGSYVSNDSLDQPAASPQAKHRGHKGYPHGFDSKPIPTNEQ